MIKKLRASERLLRSSKPAALEGGRRTLSLVTPEARAEAAQGKPLVTVVTTVRNGALTIRDAIASVRTQTYPHIEHIVIDACSSDGTLDILREQGDALEYWISENDSGFAEGWNKGVLYSRGEIVVFLSHDDFFDHQAVEQAVRTLIENKADLVFGYTKFEQPSGGWVRDRPSLNPPEKLHRSIGFMYPTCFQRMTVYERVGQYDESLRIAVDSEFLLRCMSAGMKFAKGSNTTYMRRGGVSDRKWLQGYREYLLELRRSGLLKVPYWWAVIRAHLLSIIVGPWGQDAVLKVKGQFFFFLLAPVNALLAYVPTFALRHAVLNACGVSVHPTAAVHRKLKLFHFGRVSIGPYTVVNNACYLDNRGTIKIGSNVSIAHNVRIYTSGHDVDDDCFSLKLQHVNVEDHVCIFSNALVMPGVTIAEGAVVLAGAVVTRDVAPWMIVGGNPAMPLRRRGFDQVRYRLDYKFWLAR